MRERAPVPDDLTREERAKLYAWVQRHNDPRIRARLPNLRLLVDACLSHHGASGNRHGYSDWYRACQKWIVNDLKYAIERREREYPQEAGPRGEEFVGLADVIPMFKSE